jgi:hypothetical protein
MLQQRAAQPDSRAVTARVALTAGAKRLQQQLLAHFPTHTLIVDIIHASEYLWATANALLGETSVARTAWIRTKLEQLLGQTTAVITALETEADAPARTDGQRTVIKRTIGYYQRNLPSMHYDHYLAQGWPVGTAWWRVTAAIWSKTGWSRRAWAGRRTVPKRCAICGPCGSTATGRPISNFIVRSNINGCMGSHLRPWHQQRRYSRWQPDAIPRIVVTLYSFEHP